MIDVKFLSSFVCSKRNCGHAYKEMFSLANILQIVVAIFLVAFLLLLLCFKLKCGCLQVNLICNLVLQGFSHALSLFLVIAFTV